VAGVTASSRTRENYLSPGLYRADLILTRPQCDVLARDVALRLAHAGPTTPAGVPHTIVFAPRGHVVDTFRSGLALGVRNAARSLHRRCQPRPNRGRRQRGGAPGQARSQRDDDLLGGHAFPLRIEPGLYVLETLPDDVGIRGGDITAFRNKPSRSIPRAYAFSMKGMPSKASAAWTSPL